MAIPSIKWLRRIGIALAAVVSVGVLLWAASFWWRRLSLPWDSQTAIASAVPAVAIVWAIWWVWWRLPRRQVAGLSLKIRDPKARADVEDNFRKTVGQALGGAAVLIGAGAAYLQFTQQQQTATQQIIAQQKIASDQIAAQQQAAEVSRQASEELLISNQVAKGFERLAGEKLAMRLGGIYALEGVMNTSDQYHQPVLEALCAFVREGTKPHAGMDRPPATDIQAALTAIGRRGPGLGGVNLTAVLISKANLSGAHLGAASLSGADLSLADLTGADLSAADLPRANLASADLPGANLSGANLFLAALNSANLTGADLSGADLNGADLLLANLSGANLSGANLGFASWAGVKGNIRVNLRVTHLG